MNHFNLIEFARIVRDLQFYECACETRELTDGSAHEDVPLKEAALKLFGETMSLTRQMSYQDCYDIAATSSANVRAKSPNISALRVYIQVVKDAVIKQAFYGKFLFVQGDRSDMVDKPDLLGAHVALVFPDAMPDIRDAGNCLAAECNTAAVFHLMRVVEWGLRDLCYTVGMKSVQGLRKSGSVKHTPISHSQWESILNQLRIAIDAKINRMKPGLAKQRNQEFYYAVLQDISGIRDAWRNHVMHTRSDYNRDDAAAILSHVRRIMQSLAARSKRTPQKRALPTIHSAKWGIGGDDYRDVSDLLKGYLTTTTQIRAANNFFVDHYPTKHKHLVVEFSLPGTTAVLKKIFKEGERVRLTK